MSAEQRVKDLALDLPPPPKSAGNYVPGVQVGNLLFLSGCGPQRADGSTILGKVGIDLDVEQAYAAARVAGLAMLARIRLVAGSLDRVARVVKVLGMVNAAPDFKQQPKIDPWETPSDTIAMRGNPRGSVPITGTPSRYKGSARFSTSTMGQPLHGEGPARRAFALPLADSA